MSSSTSLDANSGALATASQSHPPIVRIDPNLLAKRRANLVVDQGIDKVVQVATPVVKGTVDTSIVVGGAVSATAIKFAADKIAPGSAAVIGPQVDACMASATANAVQAANPRIQACMDSTGNAAKRAKEPVVDCCVDTSARAHDYSCANDRG